MRLAPMRIAPEVNTSTRLKEQAERTPLLGLEEHAALFRMLLI
ncbi:hypothetical protein [Deinococcus frigens]|nr:hypothetical protein [Deinococcus frigens]